MYSDFFQCNLSIAYKKAVEQLREIYDGMTSYQQQFVPDETLGTLREYEEKMKELVLQAEQSSSDKTETEEGSKEEDTEDIVVE